MEYEEYDSPRSQEELLASLPRIRIRDGSVGGEVFFTVLKTRRDEFTRGGLDFHIKGTLSPGYAGTRVRFRVGPGPSSLITLLLLLCVDLYGAVRFLIKGPSAVSPLFLLIGGAALLILLVFYHFLRKEVREDFLRRLKVRATPDSPI